MSVFAGLGIGAKALHAYEAAMQTIGHNISNADTDGFSRQRVTFGSSNPDILSFGSIGTGVEVTEIRRVRTAYFDTEMRQEQSELGKWEQISESLSRLEVYFNEPGENGLGQMMQELWQKWYDVSNDPENETNRVALTQYALLFTNTVNDLDTKIEQIRSDIDETIETKVDEINILTSQIASLNEQIVSDESGGLSVANDLRDERDLLVEKLAKIIPIVVNEHQNGGYIIYMDNKPLVAHTEASTLTTVQNGLHYDVAWSDSNETFSSTEGELGGLLTVRDTDIPTYADNLDTLMEGFILEVNKLHSQGWGLSGYSTMTSEHAVDDASEELATVDSGLDFYDEITTGNDFYINVINSSTGAVTTTAIDVDATTTLTSLAADIDAVSNVSASVSSGYLTIDADAGYTFTVTDDSTNSTNALAALGMNTFFTGVNADDISVSTTVQNDSDKIAAAATNNPGDNSIARSIADLQNQNTLLSSTVSLEAYYQAYIVGTLGVDANEAARMEEVQSLVVDNIANNIDEVSGVSLDEEMANLMQFQHAYQAVAKYISLSSAMLNELVNLI